MINFQTKLFKKSEFVAYTEKHKFNDLFTGLLSKCFEINCENPRQFIVQELKKEIGGSDDHEIQELKTEIADLRQQLEEMKLHRDSFKVCSSEVPAIVYSPFSTETSFDLDRPLNNQQYSYTHDAKKNATESDSEEHSIVSNDNTEKADEETIIELFNTSDDDVVDT